MRDMTLHLTTERQRWLGTTDPTARDMLLSCGTEVHHAQVAFAGLGWATTVHRIPSSLHPDRLAALEFWPREPTEHDIALSAAICTRRSDRRPYDPRRTATDDDLQPVLAAAQRPGIHISAIDSIAELDELDQLVRQAIDARDADPAWRIEQRMWAGPYLAPGVGVPPSNMPQDRQRFERPFYQGTLTEPVTSTDDVGQILLLATDDDDPRSCLEAGEATSALLLEATAAGLSTCTLSLVTEVDSTRSTLRHRFLSDAAEPQLLIRIGRRPLDSEPLPATPRLRLDEILQYATGPSIHLRRSAPMA
jgi:nitroreductase